MKTSIKAAIIGLALTTTLTVNSAEARGYGYDYGFIEPVAHNNDYSNIYAIQSALEEAGYFVGPAGVTGKLNSSTREAVRQFQADNGLKIDGVVGTSTASLMNHINYRTRAADNRYYGNARVGMDEYSRNVLSVQSRLSELGYFVGRTGATGEMNSSTIGAIKQFQADNGLVADGVVDTLTANALNGVATWRANSNAAANAAGTWKTYRAGYAPYNSGLEARRVIYTY